MDSIPTLQEALKLDRDGIKELKEKLKKKIQESNLMRMLENCKIIKRIFCLLQLKIT